MSTRRPVTPMLFLIAGGLFGVAAIRDALFPYFFSHGNGNALANAALCAVFVIFGVGLRRARPAASERSEASR